MFEVEGSGAAFGLAARKRATLLRMPRPQKGPAKVPTGRCGICRHPERARLDSLILAGTKLVEVARQAGVGQGVVGTHMRKHIRSAIYGLQRNFETREILYAEGLLAKVERLLVETVDILQDAREGTQDARCPACGAGFEVRVNDVRSRVAAAGQVGRTLELVGKITGEVRSGDVTQLFLNLGVNGEQELRNALALQRSASAISLDEAFADATAALELVLRERPELGSRLAAWYNNRSYAQEVQANGNGTEANGH